MVLTDISNLKNAFQTRSKQLIGLYFLILKIPLSNISKLLFLIGLILVLTSASGSNGVALNDAADNS